MRKTLAALLFLCPLSRIDINPICRTSNGVGRKPRAARSKTEISTRLRASFRYNAQTVLRRDTLRYQRYIFSAIYTA